MIHNKLFFNAYINVETVMQKGEINSLNIIC